MMKVYNQVILKNYLGEMTTRADYLQRLGYFAALFYYWKSFYNEDYNRYFFSALGQKINETLDKAKQQIAQQKNDYFKFQMFNGHAENILLFQSLMGLSSFDCVLDLIRTQSTKNQCLVFPDFTANILIELAQEDKDLQVRLYYNGYDVPLCEGNNPCSYDQFQEKLKRAYYQEDQEVLNEKYCYVS